MSVLSRSGRAFQGMRTGLVHRHIPHRVLAEPGNRRPTDARSMLSLITAALNPVDEIALRIAGAPGYPNKNRSLPRKTFDLIRKEARERGDNLITTALTLMESPNPNPDAFPVRFVEASRMTVEIYLAGDDRDLESLMIAIQELVARSKPPGLEEPEDQESAALLALCRETPPLPGESCLAHLLRFMDQCSLVLHPARWDGDRDGVTFSSIHHAKGRRWDVVLLPDVSDQTIPGRVGPYSSDLLPESRLFHTAITRARKRLYLYCLADTGQSDHSVPSRFLDPIRHFLEETDVPRASLDPFGDDPFGHLRPR